MARKRANGEGSLTCIKRNVNGKTTDMWRYRFPDGRQIHAKTQKEVLAKRDAILKEDITYVKKSEKSKIILIDYINAWLKVKEKTLKQRTFETYTVIVKSQIKDFSEYDIANMQLGSITENNLNEYYLAMANHGYTMATIKKTKMILTQCLNYAMEEDIINLNLNKVKVPNEQYIVKKEKEMHILNDNDIRTFINDCNEYRRYGINSFVLLFLLYSGLRVGECIALTKKDINYDKKIITINKAVSFVHNKPIVTTPKTKASNRTIPLTNPLKEIIESVGSDNNIIFSNNNGNYIEPSHLRRTLNGIIKKGDYSVEALSLHELRHTYVSMLLANGVAIETVSKLVGHNNISVTSRIYHQLLDEQKIKEVEFMQNISINKDTQ